MQIEDFKRKKRSGARSERGEVPPTDREKLSGIHRSGSEEAENAQQGALGKPLMFMQNEKIQI